MPLQLLIIINELTIGIIIEHKVIYAIPMQEEPFIPYFALTFPRVILFALRSHQP